jgi:TonB family protein
MKNSWLRISVFGMLLGLWLAGVGLIAQDASQQTTDTVYDLRNAGENGITSPKAIYHPDPEYTDKARKKKTRGTVLLSMIVTPQGNVREPQIIQSLDKELDKQALKAVSQWKFEPATKDGKSVAVRIRTEISFNVY